ncbi:MAG: hypothetical protein HY064_09880 [Bacteroidetes bacterium]|nr:hypothetical protein [Bacteroidota bacterium]
MKKLIFIFLLLIFCGNVFSQEHTIVVYSNRNEKECDTIKIGDYVTIDLISEKRKTGIISDIKNNYFVVGNDTVKTESVNRIYFQRHNPRKVGKRIMIAGGLMVGSGIVLILFNSHDFGRSALGALSIVVGSIDFIVGAVIHKKETKAKRLIGSKWGLIII